MYILFFVVYSILFSYVEQEQSGCDIKDFENLSAGQVAQNFHLSGWLTDLSATIKSVYYTE